MKVNFSKLLFFLACSCLLLLLSIFYIHVQKVVASGEVVSMLSPVQAHATTTIYIDNAALNISYTLWWDGDKTVIWSNQFTDAKYLGTDPLTNQNAGIINNFKIDKDQRSDPYKLCFKADSFTVTAGATCSQFVMVSVVKDTPTNQNPISGTPSSSSSQKGVIPTTPPSPPPCKTFDKVTGNCSVVPTALGDFNVEPSQFITRIFSLLLGIGGGIAVLIIIMNGYKLMTSQGDPEKIKGARESITSAIVGLLFIIFSLVILQIIGVDILHIPGFKP